MAPTPEHPNNQDETQDETTDLVTTERPIPEPEMSMLTPENVTKLGLVSQVRFAAGGVISNKWYERVQSAATATSVFGELLYRGGCLVANMPADEDVACALRLGPLPLFAANFGLKLAARGPDHLKTPEGWIDPISIAAEAATGLHIGNVRLARLLKGMKGARQVAKFMRATQVAMGKQSLEDKSMCEISQYITWYTMGLVGGMPLVADFQDLRQYTEPSDFGEELLFNLGVVAGGRWLNHKIRGVIHKNYTQDLDEARNEVKRVIAENPELAYLEKEFEYFDKDAVERVATELGLSDSAPVRSLLEKLREAEQVGIHPSLVWQKWAHKYNIDADYADYATKLDCMSKNEILVILSGALQTLVDMKHMVNPVGEDLEKDEKGNIKTKEIDAVVMVTDLRNFTALTTSERIEGHIFAFLKLNYFAYLKHVIRKFEGKILNHTGDGLVIYFKDKEGLSSKEDRAIACAYEINKLTNLMDEVWHKEDIVNPEDNHQTGIGLAWGTVKIGDVLTLSQNEGDETSDEGKSGLRRILAVQTAFEKEAVRISPWIDVVSEEKRQGGVSRLVGLGEPINLAARLESISKLNPKHTAFIRESQLVNLPIETQLEYEELDRIELKGVRAVERIYGLPRYREVA